MGSPGRYGHALGELSEAAIDFRQLLGGVNVGHPHGLDRIHGTAEHVAECGVRPQESVRGRVDNDHAIGDGLEEDAISRFRLSKRLLAPPGHLFGLEAHQSAAHHGGHGVQGGQILVHGGGGGVMRGGTDRANHPPAMGNGHMAYPVNTLPRHGHSGRAGPGRVSAKWKPDGSSRRSAWAIGLPAAM